MPDIIQQILDMYPQFRPMLDDPELRYLIVANTDPDHGFNSGNFSSALMKTNWWRQHNASQRNWLQETMLDPASAEQKLQSKINDLRNLSYQSGLGLTDDELRWETHAALAEGWTDQQIRQNLLGVARLHGQGNTQTILHGGSLGSAAEQVRGIASQYAVPITDQDVGWNAEALWQGEVTPESIKGSLAQRAINAWGASNPDLVRAINEGQTTRQYLDPQISAVASTLEMNPDRVDLLNPKYSALLNYTDKTGKVRIMTVPESQVWARSQDEFQGTVQGRGQASDMVQSLAKTFGQVR